MNRLGVSLTLLLLTGLLTTPAVVSARQDAALTTLFTQSDAAIKSSQWSEAIRLLTAAADSARASGDARNEAKALNDLGMIYRRTGQPAQAMQRLDRALSLYQTAKDKRGEGVTLANVGLVYADLGQPVKASENLNRALPLLEASGDTIGQAKTLSAIAAITVRLEDADSALPILQKALKLYQQVGDASGEAITLTNLGAIQLQAGNSSDAIANFEKALPLLQQQGDKRAEATTHINLGGVYLASNNTEKARVEFDAAVRINHELGDRKGEAKAWTAFGLLCDKLGRLKDAETAYMKAIALEEGIRAGLSGLSTDTQSAFLAESLDVYRSAIRVLLKQRRFADALLLAQKTKARTLLDLMATGKVDLSSRLSPAERDTERGLRQKCDSLAASMINEGVQNEPGSRRRFLQYQEDLSSAEQELTTFQDRLYARYPDLADRRAARTLTRDDLTMFLPSDTVLLEYVTLKGGSGGEIVVFILTNDGSGNTQVSAMPLEVKAEDLKKSILRLRLACNDPDRDAVTPARSLYNDLIPEPVAEVLEGKKRIVICPDGPLWDVPFAVLSDGAGKPLLVKYELEYAYSATSVHAAILARRRREVGGETTVLVLANPYFGDESRFGGIGSGPVAPPARPIPAPDRKAQKPARPIPAPDRKAGKVPGRTLTAPDRGSLQGATRQGRLVPLPGTQREADLLKKDYPTTALVLTGKAAQESVVKKRAGEFRYLHFATHGILNDASPLLSSLVFAAPTPGSGEDGYLTAREIFDLDLKNCELTVLSACNTGRGESRSGEGVIGLTWALFAAGSPTQVVSQWPVNDSSTALLMERFYQNLKSGQYKGDALRKAALSLRAEKGTSHPYYWAPFILVGDWR